METWIDSHCHLEYDYDGRSPLDILSAAKSAGVSKFITIGTEVDSYEKIRPIAESDKDVFFTLGVHPHDSSTLDNVGLNRIEKQLAEKKCVALGEIGLDYFYEHSPKDIQVKALGLQLDLARKVKKPVVIHSRDAETELHQALSDYVSRGAVESPGVIHCFTGTYEFGKKCLDLGFFISISGICTFKKAAELRETIKKFPADRLLVETDAPFLAPEPMRGKKNEPGFLIHTGQFLAKFLGVDLAEFAGSTRRNTEKLFGLNYRG